MLYRRRNKLASLERRVAEVEREVRAQCTVERMRTVLPFAGDRGVPVAGERRDVG